MCSIFFFNLDHSNQLIRLLKMWPYPRLTMSEFLGVWVKLCIFNKLPTLWEPPFYGNDTQLSPHTHAAKSVGQLNLSEQYLTHLSLPPSCKPFFICLLAHSSFLIFSSCKAISYQSISLDPSPFPGLQMSTNYLFNISTGVGQISISNSRGRKGTRDSHSPLTLPSE